MAERQTHNVLQLPWYDLRRSYGGIQTVISALDHYLPRVGFKNVIRVLPAANYFLVATGFSRFHIPLASFTAEIKSLIDESGAQVVHTHNIHVQNAPGVAEALQAVLKQRGVAHVTTVHDVHETNLGLEVERQRRVLSSATCVATSGFIARRLQAILHIEAADTIELGIPFPPVETHTCESDLITICCPGRLIPQKGLLDAVFIAGHLSEEYGALQLLLSSTKHAVVGGWFLAELRKLASHFPKLRLCFYNGRKPVPDMYRRAHLTLCIPAALEGFGLIPLESLASGRPVIVTPNGGMGWIANYDAAAILLERDFVKIAAAAKKVLDDWPMWHRKAKRLYSQLSSRFDALVMANRYAELYRKITRNRR